MIRANFNVDPKTLDQGEFVDLAADAIWVENFRYERRMDQDTELLTMMAKMIGGR